MPSSEKTRTAPMLYRKVRADMKVKKSLLVLMILVSFSFAGGQVLAAPAPPELMVNHESKQCAEYWAGDECMSCSAPAGWEILGVSPEAQCPDGYAQVDIELTCTPHKVDFCCTEGHSGAAGDCDDVVINKAKGRCAFVEDINECPALPRGWEKYGEECPFYEWADDIACLEKGDDGTVDGGGLLDNVQILVAAVLCLLACSVPLLVLLVVLGVWLWRRRSKVSAKAAGR